MIHRPHKPCARPPLLPASTAAAAKALAFEAAAAIAGLVRIRPTESAAALLKSAAAAVLLRPALRSALEPALLTPGIILPWPVITIAKILLLPALRPAGRTILLPALLSALLPALLPVLIAASLPAAILTHPTAATLMRVNLLRTILRLPILLHWLHLATSLHATNHLLLRSVVP